jgi:hypothetical protein
MKRTVVTLIGVLIAVLAFLYIHKLLKPETPNMAMPTKAFNGTGEVRNAPLTLPKIDENSSSSSPTSVIVANKRAARYSDIPIEKVIIEYEQNSEDIGRARNASELKKALEEAYSLAPTRDDLKGRSAEANHETPAFIMQYGIVLSALETKIESSKDSPNLILPFYDECAQDATLVTAVRTMCIFHYIERAPAHGVPVDESKFDAQLLSNAKLMQKK